MIEAPEVKAKLLADSTVVSLVGEYSSVPAIFGTAVIPDTYTDDGISMYRSAPFPGGLDYIADQITVNCYSKSRGSALDIQDAVFKGLNRSAYGADTFFRCSKLQVISPAQTGGDYNAPVEVLMRQR